MIQLYYGPISPYTRKVRIILAEKELPFEPVTVNLLDPPAEFLATNPNMRIPALRDGELQLFESNVILDYLLETYPGRGSAEPPLSEKLLRPEQRWEDSKILMTVETVLDSGLNIFQFRRSDITAEQAPYLKREAERIQSDLDWLEQKATPEGFVPGSFSALDLNLICTLEWADFREIFSWRGRPNLEKLVERYKDRESISATRPTE